MLGVHSHTEQQMRYAMELMRQFNLDAYIHHGQATLELAEELLELGMPVSYGPILPGDSRESGELLGPVKLVELGGLVAFHQDPRTATPTGCATPRRCSCGRVCRTRTRWPRSR